MNSNENPQSPVDETATAATTRKPRHRRNLLIGLGAAVALVAMGGGAYAVGTAAADEDDDRTGVHAASDDDHSSDDRDDDDGDRDGVRPSDAPYAASDAAALRAAAEQAIAHADGTGVTAIEVERGGYDIDVLRADGTEIDVFIGADGTVRTDDTDDEDDDDDPLLDLAKLGDILAAAQSAATTEAGAAGVVDSVSTSDGSSRAYEVDLRLDDRRDVEIELADDLTVVAVDIDD